MDLNLLKYIEKHEWKKIAEKYSYNALVYEISFKDCLRVAYNLAYGYELNQELQNYAIALLLLLRKSYPDKWEASWRNDAFLGNVISISCTDNHEKYYAYKRAYEKASPPPPSLLIAFSGCDYIPDHRFFSRDYSAQLLHKALESGPYINAICGLRMYYKQKKIKSSMNIGTKSFKNINKTLCLTSP